MSSAPPSATASNAELMLWTIQALNQKDATAVSRFWTSESVQRFPDGVVCHGGEEIATHFEYHFAAMSDWHMEVIAIAEAGDTVLMRWLLTGTHDGPFAGIAPTGRPVAVDGVDHVVFRDGKLVSNFIIVDQLQYARQLGLLPAEKSFGDRLTKGLFNLSRAPGRLLQRMRARKVPVSKTGNSVARGTRR